MTFLQDTFTEAEPSTTVDLVDHTPDVGGAWESLPFTTSDVTPLNDTIVYENVAQTRESIDGRGAAHRSNTDPGSDEYDITATVALNDASTGADRYWAIMWRMSETGTTDTEVDRYMMIADANFAQWELYKTIGGSDNRVTLDIASDPSIPGGTFDVRIEVRKTRMSVYVDDVLTLSSGDTQISQRGRVGVACGKGDFLRGHWMDDLVCTAVTNPGAVDMYVIDENGDEQPVTAHVLHNNIERPVEVSAVP